MSTTRGERRFNQYPVPEVMCGKPISHFLQNDALVDQNIPCYSRVLSFHLLTSDGRADRRIHVSFLDDLAFQMPYRVI